MLEIKNLIVSYGAINALQSVSLAVPEGGIVTLIGSNGAGKTTTLKTVSGLLKPKAGEIIYAGKSIAGRPPHEIVKRGLAHVPEGRMIFANLTVLENLQMGAYLVRDKKIVRRELEFVFATFPRLKEREQQVAGTLSGGEQQMLAIGRALMTNPELLILDEATEGLAPLIREEIWNCLSMLKARGQSILVIDKNIENLTRIADRHYIIERGKAVWSGTSAELIAEPDLQHRFLGV